jgi:hypothetical protein
MPLIRWGLRIGLCLLLAACQSLGTENVPATMQNDLTAYAVQATEIRVTGEVRATEASATIVAAQTQAAYFDAYNQVLVATVRAGETPVPAQVLVTDGELEGSLGVAPNMEFLQLAMSDRINDADRCALNDVALFDVTQTPKLYLTGVVTNMPAGTRLQVLWEQGGQQVHSTNWTATDSSTNTCIAMELTPDQVNFVSGDWEAILIADERVIKNVPFVMIEPAPKPQ